MEHKERWRMQKSWNRRNNLAMIEGDWHITPHNTMVIVNNYVQARVSTLLCIFHTKQQKFMCSFIENATKFRCPHSQILTYADLVLWYKKESAMSTLSLSLYASLYMCLSMYVSLYISLYVSRGRERARMETSPTLSYNRIEDTCFLWAIYCNFDIKIPDSIKSVQKLSMNLLYM